ncbi:MAG: hypothetical protein K1W26_01270 [Acetatifactor sp.]
MEKQAILKGKDNCKRRHVWEKYSMQSTEMIRYANGWQKGEIFLPMYIALNNSV